jgi:hypothetical protein
VDLFLIFEVYREMIEEANIRPTSHTFSILLSTARAIHNAQRDYLKYENNNRVVVLRQYDPSKERRANDFTDLETLDENQLFLLKEFRFSDKVLAIYKEMQIHLLDQSFDSSEAERKYGKTLPKFDDTKEFAKLDAYLLNQMAQSLAQAGHLEEAHNLVFNVLKPQFLLITPTTCLILLRKTISKHCYSLEQFNVRAKPIMALLRDNMATAGKAATMTVEDLTQIVSIMVKNFKSSAMIMELLQYVHRYFKVQLVDAFIDSQLPGALRVSVRELYNPRSNK